VVSGAAALVALAAAWSNPFPATAAGRRREVGAQAIIGAQSRGRSNKSTRGRRPSLSRTRSPRRRLASNNSQRDRGKAYYSENSLRHRTKVAPLGWLGSKPLCPGGQCQPEAGVRAEDQALLAKIIGANWGTMYRVTGVHAKGTCCSPQIPTRQATTAAK
jgi:hypothetical protein